MTTMQEYMVTCGTGQIPARLPADRTRIVPGPPQSAAPLPDAAAPFRRALEHPVGMPPLQQLVGTGAKVTIAIQDGRLPNYHPEDQDLRILRREKQVTAVQRSEIDDSFSRHRSARAPAVAR